MNISSVDRHSYFQLKYFIIGKEPTTQSKLWRCVKEANARKESISAISLEIEDKLDTLELLNLEVKKNEFYLKCDGNNFDTKDNFANTEFEIKIRKLKRQIKSVENSIASLKIKLKYTQDEIDFFEKTFSALEKIEKIKPFDDLDAQLEYWNEKLSQELNLNLVLQKPLDTELVKTILSLNNSPVKNEMLTILNKLQDQAIKVDLLEVDKDKEKESGK